MAQLPILTEVEEQDLSTELSRDVLETLAPDELPFFDEVVTDSRNQRKVISAKRRDEPLGFGIELSLLAPYVVAVMPTVIHFLGGVFASVAEQEAATGLKAIIRQLFRHEPSDGASKVKLTAEQGRQIQEMTCSQAMAVGLNRERAGLLADAVVGALAIADVDDH